MPFIPEKEAGELKAELESHLTAPVTMDLFVRPVTGLWVPGRRDCETCEDARKLLEEVAALSERITLRVHDVSAEPEAAAAAGLEADQVPAVVLTGAASGRVRFLGIPAGLEFVTPDCPFCLPAALIAHQMAVESGRVTADVVEAQEFPELAARYNVRGVPKVVVNETVEFSGAQPEARFLDHVLRAAA